ETVVSEGPKELTFSDWRLEFRMHAGSWQEVLKFSRYRSQGRRKVDWSSSWDEGQEAQDLRFVVPFQLSSHGRFLALSPPWSPKTATPRCLTTDNGGSWFLLLFVRVCCLLRR
ncbi:hypothetical protein BaRGS_00000945, partial [Batillaria attramentaria]